MTRLTFQSEGYKLAGNLFTPKSVSKKLAFLFIQGWQGHQNIEAAKTLMNLGLTTMTYDMRGNGESEGDISLFSRSDFIKDAVNAYDYFKAGLDNEASIVVVGSSFGSYTAVLLSQEREVFGLSLRVPASYPDEGYDEPQRPNSDPYPYDGWPAKVTNFSQNHAFSALHNFKGKIQIIEAGADRIVPSQSVKNYANAVANKNNLTYTVMENAPHRLENEELQLEYEDLLTKWVKNL